VIEYIAQRAFGVLNFLLIDAQFHMVCDDGKDCVHGIYAFVAEDYAAAPVHHGHKSDESVAFVLYGYNEKGVGVKKFGQFLIKQVLFGLPGRKEHRRADKAGQFFWGQI
jgi:hypothetical protein